MLCTLQSVACSARSCEHHVISLLVSTTGQGHMNSEIVKKGKLKCILHSDG